MKLFSLLSLVLCSLVALAQNKTYPGLTVTPPPLRAGQTITIQYNPAATSLKEATHPIRAVVTTKQGGKNLAEDVTLAKGKVRKPVYTATYTVPADAHLLAVSFKSGTQTDANDANGYFYPVNSADGKEQPETLAGLAEVYSGDYYLGIENDKPELAKKYYQRWLAEAGATATASRKIKMASSFRDTATICQLASDVKNLKGLTENEYETLSRASTMVCKDKSLGAAVTQVYQQQYPNGNWKYNAWMMNINGAKTAIEKYTWWQAFQLAFPDDAKKEKPYAISPLLSMVLRGVNSELDATLLEKILGKASGFKDKGYSLTNALNSVAWRLAEKDSILPTAEKLSAKSLELYETEMEKQVNRPEFITPTDYRSQLEESYAMAADTYGYILEKLGKPDSAFAYLEKGARLGNYASLDVNKRLVANMAKTQPPAAVVRAITEMVKAEGYDSETMRSVYLDAAKKSGVANPEASLAALEKAASDKKFAKIKSEMVNEPGVDFSLTDVDGKPVNLANYKGKVVIIDFWATWCGPCIASFPGMQKAVDATKNDNEVAFLFLNTWQSEKDKVAEVKRFMNDKPYTFHIVMDDKNEVVTKYGVRGIPTKFILDKNGNIRFKVVGYNGSADKTRDELLMMIQVAKAAK